MKIKNNKNVIILFLLLVLLNCIVFFQIAKSLVPANQSIVFNLDTLIYMQYAKAWANGHPYCFNQGDSPTTGASSHLYPAILSIFFKTGFNSFSLIDITLWINALFLILSAYLYCKIIIHMFPDFSTPVVLLFIFSGHLPLIVLGLSDMGLFLLLTMITWYAFLYNRRILFSFVLFLLPFTRPEGIYILLVFLFLVIVFKLFKIDIINDRISHEYKFPLIMSIISIVLLFTLHFLLTGQLLFDSFGSKGYYHAYPFLLASQKTIYSFIQIIRDCFLGLEGNYRQFYFFPIISGLLILLGISKQLYYKNLINTKSILLQLWWIILVFTTFIMTAMSGWSGLHFDRYFTWILPLLYPFLILGCDYIPKYARKFIVYILVSFQIFVFPYFLHAYCLTCNQTATQIEEIKLIHKNIPSNSIIGVSGGSGIKYFLDEYHIINISGITSPYFRNLTTLAESIKNIQYFQEQKFDYYLSFTNEIDLPRNIIKDTLIIEVPTPQKRPLYIFTMNWNSIRQFNDIQDNTIRYFLKDKCIIDSLDIGYNFDEKRCIYSTYCIFPSSSPQPFLQETVLDSITYCDTFRPVLGYDSFTFKTEPGLKHWLVIRLLKKAEILINSINGVNNVSANTEKVKKLFLKIDNQYQMSVQLPPWEQYTEINEVIVPISSDKIRNTKTRFKILGDHIVSDYWIYSE